MPAPDVAYDEGEYGVWRDLVGSDWSESYDPDAPNPPLRRDGPIETRIEGTGLPWIDGLEDPNASSGLLAPSKNPQIDEPDIGWEMPPGDYTGAYRTRGPVVAFGHEASGGMWGDQALGRIMRFPANIPDRYDANGVWVGDYRDQLAATLAANQTASFADTVGDVANLLEWTGPGNFVGWEG